ncbi:segregation and condensation protein A [Brassicibacter mesophilus]|uniref:segregation and condensation protein A n=1 Tax=Brassicibacter mesophilus TaxID=745119 RepID=UPI003D22C7F9
MDYKIVLESFEGPLDLLFHLIEKEKVDIYDIPIAKITDQYISYIKSMQEIDLDITSEFLVMAANLLEIKSKMLLPSKKDIEGEQLEIEDVDPREELVRRLLEYKKFKMAAEELKSKGDIRSKIYFKPKEELDDFVQQDDNFELDGLELKELIKVYNKVIVRCLEYEKKINVTEIQRDEITIEESMANITTIIKDKKTIEFEELFEGIFTRSRIVVTFLSILELIKLKIIKVVQDKNFEEITIILNQT